MATSGHLYQEASDKHPRYNNTDIVRFTGNKQHASLCVRVFERAWFDFPHAVYRTEEANLADQVSLQPHYLTCEKRKGASGDEWREEEVRWRQIRGQN